MKKNDFRIIGVMSGTSLDGIDIVNAELNFGNSWNYKIIQAETIPYSENWQKALVEAINYSPKKLEAFNKEYTVYLADIISSFIRKNKIEDIDAVCSHGHTIKHEPQNQFTLQIGNLPELATLTGQKVVCDFRVQDVNLGGQGAPLVPVGDALLFSDYEYCLNLGGFANISSQIDGERIAYDVCPVNTVLNYYSQKLGRNYDEGGRMAASGEHNAKLLYELNGLGFYARKPPKSLGIEWVKSEIFPICKKYEENIPSILRTFSEHIALQISEAIDDKPEIKVLVTGGGAFNDYLISQLEKHSKSQYIIPSKELIDYKEALIFGLLGVLKLRGENNILKSVTGAGKDHSSGVIFTP